MIQLIDVLASGVTDASGLPLSSGQVYVYGAGTTTLQTVYEDRELENPHPNPLTLDDAGCVTAYAEDRVKIVVISSAGSTIRTVDNVGISDSDITAASVSEAAGSGLVAGGDDTLDVDVDGTTITISANKVKIANSAVLPGSPQSESNFTVGVDLDVLGHITAGGIVTATTSVRPTGPSNATITSTAAKTALISDGSRVLPIVTSISPGSGLCLTIVRGSVNSSGTKTAGEGFTSVRNSSGNFTITFSTAFSVAPVAVASITASGTITANVTAASTTALTVLTFVGGSSTDSGFNFVAIGER